MLQGSRSRAASTLSTSGEAHARGGEGDAGASHQSDHDADTNKYWAAKHHRVQRYIKQSHLDAEWFAHEKHVFIFSWAGRPIYSRYGDENEISDFMGVMASFIANFQRLGDSIQAFIAGDYKFVFLFRGPFYLVSISRSPETIPQLQQQLALAHQQIISVLSSGAHQILETHPSYDIRQQLAGTELLLHDVVNDSERLPSLVFDSVPVLRLNKPSRGKIMAALKKGPKNKSKKLLYSILIAGGRLVAFHRERDAALHVTDLHLLINFLTNSHSLRTSDGWAPFCLPCYNADCFMYAYVSYVARDVCLCFVTSDPADLRALRLGRGELAKVLEARDIAQDLSEAVALQSWTVDDIADGSPDLRHFVFRSLQLNQYVASAPAEPYADADAPDQGLTRLLRRYQRAVGALSGGEAAPAAAATLAQPSTKALATAAAQCTKHSLYYEVGQDAVVLGWVRPGDFELYATFLPLTSKETALAASHRILHWIKREEPNLFIAQ
jgi:hypothetical protein